LRCGWRLLDYYVVSVYPIATSRTSDREDEDRESLPTLMCEHLVKEWTGRLELMLGQGAAERLLRTAGKVLRDWTIEIPGSTLDVYPYEVNVRAIQTKRVLLDKVLKPGWTLPQDGGVAGPPQLPPQLQIQVFVAVNGQKSGPFDMSTLRQMADTGQLTRDSLVWMDGMASWVAASTVTGIASVFGAVPPPLPPT